MPTNFVTWMNALHGKLSPEALIWLNNIADSIYFDNWAISWNTAFWIAYLLSLLMRIA